ncbi:MAG: hypothetical protein IPL52_00390 [Flavobacteriales bacterium]|nr:hypothetical protein [Flavobacteriales bacterium]
MSLLLRIISYLWPVRVAHAHGAHGELEVRYETGRLVLNSAHGNQSFGSLHRVWQQVFARMGLREHPPQEVLMLGLGGGSIVHILREELGVAAPITAVELDPVMVELARQHFGLGVHTGLRVLVGDATLQVHSMRERYDLVVVDLFDDLDLARGVDTMGFAHALRDRCSGILCFNTVGYDGPSGQRCQRVKDNLGRVFGKVDELRVEGVNRVFLAR